MKIKLLIAEDIEIIQKKYEMLFQNDPDIQCLSSASSGSEAVMRALRDKPDVILMDIEMETRDAGIRASEDILGALPDTKIVVLTVNDDDKMILAAYRAGVMDYILKTEPLDVIRSAVIHAYNNQSPVRPLIAKKLRSELRRTRENNIAPEVMVALSQLTPSEVDIIFHFYKGKKRAEICRERFVTISTLKTQIHSILKKFKKDKMEEVVALLETFSFFDAVRYMDDN